MTWFWPFLFDLSDEGVLSHVFFSNLFSFFFAFYIYLLYIFYIYFLLIFLFLLYLRVLRSDCHVFRLTDRLSDKLCTGGFKKITIRTLELFTTFIMTLAVFDNETTE